MPLEPIKYYQSGAGSRDPSISQTMVDSWTGAFYTESIPNPNYRETPLPTGALTQNVDQTSKGDLSPYSDFSGYGIPTFSGGEQNLPFIASASMGGFGYGGMGDTSSLVAQMLQSNGQLSSVSDLPSFDVAAYAYDPLASQQQWSQQQTALNDYANGLYGNTLLNAFKAQTYYDAQQYQPDYYQTTVANSQDIQVNFNINIDPGTDLLAMANFFIHAVHWDNNSSLLANVEANFFAILGAPSKFVSMDLAPIALAKSSPILLDLSGHGINITEENRSSTFLDIDGSGLGHRTAWAGAGTGVLFYDPTNLGKITDRSQYIFTQWDPTATTDMQALRDIFDSNGDGVFDGNDAKWAQFKVMRTNADGTQTALTLAQAGIASINLKVDTTSISYADGSSIDGQTTFTKTDGSKGTVATASLVAEMQGYAITTSYLTRSGSMNPVTHVYTPGMTTITNTGKNVDGTIAFVQTVATTEGGGSRTITYDNNGDGVIDRSQVIITTTDATGATTEVWTNYLGNQAVKQSAVSTTTSADGKAVTILRDTRGGGWYDQSEARSTDAGGWRTDITTNLNKDGSVISTDTKYNSPDNMTGYDYADFSGDGVMDRRTMHSIGEYSGGRYDVTYTYSGDWSVVISQIQTNTSLDGKEKWNYVKLDSWATNPFWNSIQDQVIASNTDGSSTTTTRNLGGDWTYINGNTVTKSADGLSTTTYQDLSGKGTSTTSFDRKTSDSITINTDGSRDDVVATYSSNGTLLNKSTTHLAADQVTKQVYISPSGNGISNIVESVYQNGSSSSWIDATLKYDDAGKLLQETAVYTTNTATGKNTDTYYVWGKTDGTWQIHTGDYVVKNVDGSSTETLVKTGVDGIVRLDTVVQTSADGLTTTTSSYASTMATPDLVIKDQKVNNMNGATAQAGWVTETVTKTSGNGNLLGKSITITSDDRRTVNVTDYGVQGTAAYVARTENISTAANGTVSDIVTNVAINGTTINKTEVDTAANGLTKTTYADIDGNGTWDAVSKSVRVYNADGSIVDTATKQSNNSKLLNKETIATSGSGLLTTIDDDFNGDNALDQRVKKTTTLKADGSNLTEIDTYKGSLLALASVEFLSTSANGLTVKTSKDFNGDGTIDQTVTGTTIYNADGSINVTQNTNNADGTLRNSVSNYIWADSRFHDTRTDSNGDGIMNNWDFVRYGADGSTVHYNNNYNANGTLQSSILKVTTGDDLSTSTSTDYNGDFVWDHNTWDRISYNSDGSKTETISEYFYGQWLTPLSNTSVTTAANGLSTTTATDSNGDGVVDNTRTDVTSIATDGSSTETVIDKTANGTTERDKTVATISGDGLTKTISRFTDGNGSQATQISVDATGTTKTTTTYYDAAGKVIITSASTQSANGLITSFGLGTTLSTNTSTVVDPSGNRSTTEIDTAWSYQWVVNWVEVANILGWSIKLPIGWVLQPSAATTARSITTVSGDGLATTIQEDRTNIGYFSLASKEQTVYNPDGSMTRTIAVNNVTSTGVTTQRDLWTETTSANGLSSSVAVYFTGSAIASFTDTNTVAADLSKTDVKVWHYLSGANRETLTTTVSSNQLTKTVIDDVNGNGSFVRTAIYKNVGDGNMIDTFTDSYGGVVTQTITENIAANGSSSSTKVLVNASAFSSFTNSATTTYDASTGATVITEKLADSNGHVFKSVTSVTTPNGYGNTTSTDYFGDGSVDETLKSNTVLNPDGTSIKTVTETDQAGNVVYTDVTTTSANGMHTNETVTYAASKFVRSIDSSTDVMGITTLTISDPTGSVTSTTTPNGVTKSKTYTGGATETTTFAVNAMGSYTWSASNGMSSSHTYDDSGIDAWSATVGGTAYSTTLDKVTEGEFQAIAARLFDTILDRALYDRETETLVKYIVDGKLNDTQLAQDLIASVEFTSKYAGGNIQGTTTQSQLNLIDQLYLNALGRNPTVKEILAARTALANGTVNLAVLAVTISNSSEHILAGDGHIQTNNTNLAQGGLTVTSGKDHALDTVVIANFVKEIYDTLLDRDPTASELTNYVGQIATGTLAKWDLAQALLTATGEFLQTYGSLTDTAFVNQVYLNTFGITPSASELSQWVSLLSTGKVDRASLATTLASSLDHQDTGLVHLVSAPIINVTTTGQTLYSPYATYNIASSLTETVNAATKVNLAGTDVVTLVASGITVNVSGTGNSVTGNSETINLTLAAASTIGGTSNIINLAGNNAVTVADSSSALMSGSGNTFYVGTYDTLTIAGNNNSVGLRAEGYNQWISGFLGIGGWWQWVDTTGNGDVINLTGIGNSVTASGIKLNIGANSTATLTGNNDTLTISSGSTLTINGTGHTVSGGTGTILNFTANSTDTVTGSGVVINLQTGDAITSSNNIINIAANATDTITGSGNTINLANGDTLSSASNTINVAANAAITVNGNNNTVNLTTGDIFTGGNYDIFNVASGATVTATTYYGTINLGTNAVFTDKGYYNTFNLTNGDSITASSDTINVGAGAIVSVIGSSDTVNLVNGDTITVSSNTINVAANSTDTVIGTSNAINLTNGDTLTASSNTINLAASASVTIKGTVNTINGGSGNTINFGAGSTATVNGNYQTLNLANGVTLTAYYYDIINVADGATASVTGYYDTINLGTNSTFIDKGYYNTFNLKNGDNLTASSDTINVAAGATVVVIGSSDTINLANGDTLTASNNTINIAAGASVTITGTGDTINGNTGSVVNLGSGTSATVAGNYQTINLATGVTLTAYYYDIINVANGASDTVTGYYNTVNLGTNAAFTDKGYYNTLNLTNGDTVIASSDTINIASGSTNTVTGNSDVLKVGANDNLTLIGTSETVQYGKVTGADILTGFSATDVIQFSSASFASFAALQSAMTQVGSNTLITLDAANTVTLVGINKSTLVASEFRFV